jgi:hypothetical protein
MIRNCMLEDWPSMGVARVCISKRGFLGFIDSIWIIKSENFYFYREIVSAVCEFGKYTLESQEFHKFNER